MKLKTKRFNLIINKIINEIQIEILKILFISFEIKIMQFQFKKLYNQYYKCYTSSRVSQCFFFFKKSQSMVKTKHLFSEKCFMKSDWLELLDTADSLPTEGCWNGLNFFSSRKVTNAGQGPFLLHNLFNWLLLIYSIFYCNRIFNTFNYN